MRGDLLICVRRWFRYRPPNQFIDWEYVVVISRIGYFGSYVSVKYVSKRAAGHALTEENIG